MAPRIAHRTITVLLAAVFLLILGAARPALAANTYDIPVVVPLTGGAAFVGQGHKESLEALAAEVNRTGGIQGRPLRFLFHDDGSSPQTAVQLATQILASHPPIILGSSLVAMCSAMAPLMKHDTVQFCLSPGIHPQPGTYTFSSASSSIDQIAALIRYCRMRGWTKIAVLTTTDASGQDGERGLDEVLAYPENKGIMQVVSRQHFAPTDISVAAQIEKVKDSGAQVFYAWSTGAPAATVFKAMLQAGLNLPVAPSSGNQTFASMAQWESFLPKQLLLPSALYPEHDGVLKLDPRMEKAQHAMYAILKQRGLKADNMVATSWDAGLIVVSALRKLGPNATAQQLHDYIANLTDFAGVDGIYNFKKYPERGLGPEAATVTRYDAKTKSWVWLAQPGGAPLHK